jgi:hypothetical protein
MVQTWNVKPLTGIIVQVSNVHSAVIFRAKNSEDEGATVLRNVGNYNSDTVLQSRIFNMLPNVTKPIAR